jgi:hypothetical protein
MSESESGTSDSETLVTHVSSNWRPVTDCDLGPTPISVQNIECTIKFCFDNWACTVFLSFLWYLFFETYPTGNLTEREQKENAKYATYKNC